MIRRNTFPKVYSQFNTKTGQEYYIVDARSKRYGMDDRFSFSTENEAITKAKAIAEQITKFGGQAHIPRDVVHRSDSYQALLDRLAPFGCSPETAVEHYVSYLGHQAILATIPPISVLADEFQKYKLMDKSLSPKTITEIKSYCRYVKATFGHLKPTELARNDAEMALRKMEVSNNTRRKYLTYIKMFMKWVHENKEYTAKNPLIGLNFKRDKFEKAFYSVGTLQTFFKSVYEKRPQMTAYYVLSCFAGLRPSEAARVKWSHVNFDTKELHVIKGKTDARHITLQQTALAWLSFIRENVQSKDLIPKKNLNNFDKQLRVIMPEWIQDGLRHTFASNYNSLIKNFNETAYYMGNSVSMVKQHYARTVAAEPLKAFWALTPEHVLTELLKAA